MDIERALPIAALSLYTFVILALLARALLQSRGREHSIVDEAVGKREYGSVAIAVTIAATMLGPADALALSEKGLEYGLVWVLFPLGAAAAQVVSGVVFAPRIRGRFARAMSLGDILENHCSRTARVITGMIVFLQMIAFSGVLILAGGTILREFLGIDLIFGMIYTALLVGIYSSVGGLALVITTDRFQFGFVVFIATLCFATIVTSLFTSDIGPAALTGPSFVRDHPVSLILTLLSGYFLGELLLPFYAQRALIAKSPSSAKRGFLGAAAIISVWYLIITAAGALGGISITNQNDSSIVMGVARGLFEPGTLLWHVIGAVIFAGFVALVHSTFDSILNAGSVAFSRDLLGGVMSLDDKTQGWISRQVVISIAVLGIFVAIAGDDLISLLMLGYTFWVPTLLVPLGWILLNPDARLSLTAFGISLFFGLLGWFMFEHQLQTPIPGILAGFVANLVALMISSQIFRGGSPVRWMGEGSDERIRGA